MCHAGSPTSCDVVPWRNLWSQFEVSRFSRALLRERAALTNTLRSACSTCCTASPMVQKGLVLVSSYLQRIWQSTIAEAKIQIYFLDFWWFLPLLNFVPETMVKVSKWNQSGSDSSLRPCISWFLRGFLGRAFPGKVLDASWCLALWEIAHSLFVLAGLYSTYVWSTPKSTESWRTLWTYVKMLWACCELADWISLQSLDFPMRARHHDPEMRVLQMSSPLWMWLGRKVPWRKKEKTLKELKDKEQEKDKAQINTNETWENIGKRQAHIFLHGKAYDAYLPHRNKT